jgi:hypothetical protein
MLLRYVIPHLRHIPIGAGLGGECPSKIWIRRRIATGGVFGGVMRLFFHLVSKHESIPDLEGVEVADAYEAQAVALEMLEELRTDRSTARNMSGWTLRVTDATGSVVFTLDLDNPTQ